VLNFTIPRGDTGVQGPQGAQGAQGNPGATGGIGPQGNVGPTGPAFTPAQTGTGSTFVVQSSPTINTPFITGVTNGSDAAAGQVGEYVSNINGTTGVMITPSTAGSPFQIAQISLTPGDWWVEGAYSANPPGASVAGYEYVYGGRIFQNGSPISSAWPQGATYTVAGGMTYISTFCTMVPGVRVNLTAAATMQLVASAQIQASQPAQNVLVWAGIWARRVR